MLHPLPMQFRAPLPDEALPGYLSECAERYSAHPSAILELAGCQPSLDRASFLSSPEVERLAATLSRQKEVFGPYVYRRGTIGFAGIPSVQFGGAALRRAHLVVSKRRLSPAAMRQSNHVRALSMVEPVTFCPESWTLLSERCLNPECGKPLTWPQLAHVSECHHCKADQRNFETEPVPHHLRPVLAIWADLLHPVGDRRAEATHRLPEKLQRLDPGSVFDLVLGLAGVLNDAESAVSLETIASSMQVVLNWPGSIITALDADAMPGNARRQSLSTRLLRYAQSKATLPDVRALLIYGLEQERGVGLGAKAEIARARGQVGALSIREAARHVGVPARDITKLRRDGVLQAVSISRGRARLETVTYKSCEAVRNELADRMTISEFGQATGLSDHAIAQLLWAGHIERRQSPAIDALFEGPVLARTSVEHFIAKVRSIVTPLGHNDADWVPLEKALVAVGGRPKPYGSFFAWVFDQRTGLRAPRGPDGVPDVRNLHVSPFALAMWPQFESAFECCPAETRVSATTASEILNCSPASLGYLVERKFLERHDVGGTVGFTFQSVVRTAKLLISLSEINARLGFSERSASAWLEAQKIAQVILGFASRPVVERWLRAEIPFGKLRRNALGLTIDEVRSGRAEVTDREWERARAWVPRQRKSRQGLSDRSVLNAAIWVSATARHWKDIPERYGPHEACYNRYRHWKRSGALPHIVTVLVRQRQDQATGDCSPYLV